MNLNRTPFNKKGKIKALIFDIGNVVLFFDNHKVARNIAQITGLTELTILKTVFDLYTQLEIDLGKVPIKEYFELIKEKLNLELTTKELRNIFDDIFTENHLMSSFIRRLENRIPLAAITNTNRSHYEYILNRFGILSSFKRIFASCNLGIKKPSPGIYHHAVSYLGLRAQECLFIDDQERNLMPASAMGFHVHRYRQFELFLTQCHHMGIPCV